MSNQQETQFADLDYDGVLNNWKTHNKTSAKRYIEVLCDRLRRKHPLYTNKDIRKRVTKDILEAELCKPANISKSWPEWVQKEKILLSKIPEIEAHVEVSQSIIEEYRTIDNRSAEQESEEEPTASSSGTVIEPPGPEMPEPFQVYENAVKGLEKVWSTFTTTNIHKPKRLIVSDTSDPLMDFIKPSRKIWLRTFKGLSNEDSIHLQKCLIWVHMLITDVLREAKELNKERKEIQK